MDDLLKEQNVFYNIFCVLVTKQNKWHARETALYWRSVFHSVALLHHGYVGVYSHSLDLTRHDDPRIQDMQRYGPRFLTGWNFAFQTVFLILAVIYDAAQWSERAAGHKMARARYWRDVVFNGLVVPYTLFVASMFWSLYALDRELVFPRAYDAAVPAWFNRAVHGWVLPVVALELVLQPRAPPPLPQRRLQYALCWFFSVLYAVVYYSTYLQTGRWLYPVFTVMTWWQICVYQLAIWISMHLFYELQWPLVLLLHGGGGDGHVEGDCDVVGDSHIVGDSDVMGDGRVAGDCDVVGDCGVVGDCDIVGDSRTVRRRRGGECASN